MKLINGDCLEKLKELADNSVDAIVTDPPAGISFMNKEWDDDKGGRDQWMKWLTEVFTEAKRVLKHGGHCLVWAIPRTSHWTAMACENAGFEVRDCIYHIQSQGFPKSLNVSKAIDKKFGAKREVVKKHIQSKTNPNIHSGANAHITMPNSWNITPIAVTDKAKQYDGYGSQLKPAVECWWLIRKPLEGSIVDNVLKHGTGAINIDKSRIPTEDKLSIGAYSAGAKAGINTYADNDGRKKTGTFNLKPEDYKAPQGRFPANLIHDGSDAVMEEFQKYGESKSRIGGIGKSLITNKDTNNKNSIQERGGYDDSGSVARFFYCSKASISERNLGLDGFEEKRNGSYIDNRVTGSKLGKDYEVITKNNHPTVKSVKLMSYLVNLIAPPYKSVILDMFMGTGSTGIAALLNGHDFIGIEMSEEYMKIAQARINNYEEFRKYLK